MLYNNNYNKWQAVCQQGKDDPAAFAGNFAPFRAGWGANGGVRSGAFYAVPGVKKAGWNIRIVYL
ncbi:MAG: hypothetical protein ACLTWO_03855 [Blautia massiliensis (ex Durand et al. 2017)]